MERCSTCAHVARVICMRDRAQSEVGSSVLPQQPAAASRHLKPAHRALEGNFVNSARHLTGGLTLVGNPATSARFRMDWHKNGSTGNATLSSVTVHRLS